MLKKYFHKSLIEAGCDEAGRGCLAGPVVAAAVILPKGFGNKLMNDSKQLTHNQRLELRNIILKKAIAYGVAFVDHEEIDRINILNASFKAMHLAVDQLTVRPEMLLIDGNRFKKYQDIPHECVIQGDGIYLSIAAASILAKTYRDEYMDKLHHDFPHYGWERNKGYATKLHRDAIVEHGPCSFHRRSFTLVPKAAQLELFDEELSPRQ